MTSEVRSRQCLDNNLVARIAQMLDEASIPNVLWGNYLLTVFGVPTFVEDASFVIPDCLISRAASTLIHAGLEDCSAYPTCPVVNVDFRCSPAPSAHAHVDQTICILLFKKSQTLWRLDFGPSSPSERKSAGEECSKDIMFASDPRLPSSKPSRGNGSFSPTLYPVRIPSASRLLEAYVLLMIRDRRQIYQHFWTAMLTYVCEFVEETGLIQQQDIEPRCWSVYESMLTSPASIGPTLDKLKNDKSLAPPE